MPRFAKRFRLVVLLALVGVLALVLVGRSLNATKRGGQGPAEPFRIAGNLYYVGATDASAFLITGPEGHIVLDGGYPSTAPMIIASIAKLGFSIKDVRVLLNSEPHPDHAGGLGVLQQASGGELWASDASAYTLASGGDDPDAILAVLNDRAPDHIVYDHWQAIDEIERSAGEPHGRPRVKLTRREELLEAARNAELARD